MRVDVSSRASGFAERLNQLPPYLFVELDKAKRGLVEQGKDVIDLGVGDPDLPSPPHVLARLKEAADDPANHRYGSTAGLAALRQAIARWYARRFDVTLDPETDVLPLLGSKEGIAHFPLAVANAGDAVLVPDPCYPPYRSGTILAGAQIVALPLREERGFFPDFGEVRSSDARRAKLLFLNYPNNPTAAIAAPEQFRAAVEFAQASGVAIAHDAAYSEIAYDGVRPMSFLQVEGAKTVGLEFHSLSKTYNMTGWRIGWACGHPTLIRALSQLKTHLDSGIFQPVQWAGIAALEGDQAPWREAVATYQARRDLVVQGLARAGWAVTTPRASLYLWTRVPTQESSMVFAQRLLREAHVLLTPGVGFGAAGEGYVRLSLTVPTARLEEAVARIAKAL